MEDIFGNRIEVGDIIAYGSIRYDSAVLRLAVVSNINSSGTVSTRFFEKLRSGKWKVSPGRATPKKSILLTPEMLSDDFLRAIEEDKSTGTMKEVLDAKKKRISRKLMEVLKHNMLP